MPPVSCHFVAKRDGVIIFVMRHGNKGRGWGVTTGCRDAAPRTAEATCRRLPASGVGMAPRGEHCWICSSVMPADTRSVVHQHAVPADEQEPAVVIQSNSAQKTK